MRMEASLDLIDATCRGGRRTFTGVPEYWADYPAGRARATSAFSSEVNMPRASSSRSILDESST